MLLRHFEAIISAMWACLATVLTWMVRWAFAQD